MVQGALDLGNLIGTPWLLAGAWPGSQLTLVDAAPHDGTDDTRRLLVAAADRFART
jgi:proline iminopeptidase